MRRDLETTGLTRRRALHLIGAGAGIGIASALGFQSTPARPVRFPKGAIVRTLLRDVDPDVLSTGATLFHEHLNQHSADPNSRQKFLEDVDNMIDEVRGAGRAGISCVVDAGHEDMGRNIDELKRIAVANDGGVHIVGSGGYYLQRAYPPEIATRSEDQIADELVATAARQHLGAFGEIGQSAVMTPDEHKVFRAVSKAHLRTGLPIFTHNAYNGLRPDPSPPVARDSALRQLDIFESVGVKPQSVAIGHVCCLDDPKAEISIALAKRGAFVGFDRAYGEAIIPDAMRIAMAAKLIEAGYADNLLLSSDFAFEKKLRSRGGPGLALMPTIFVPLMQQAGLSDETIHGILVNNPRRFIAFVPKAK